jgi:PAS domain S-box-containing protein
MLTERYSSPLILIVEDDNNHADLIRRSFETATEEFRLDVVTTVTAAKQAIELAAPALVLTDFRLPDGDGSDLVVMAHGQWPVIIMTSHGNEQIAVESIKIGAHDYLVKSPDAFARLPQTIGYALKSWALIVSRRSSDEAALRAKKDWERTFDAVPDMIATIDSTHTITRANKAMADRFGLPVEKLVGRACFEIVHGLNSVPGSCPCADMRQEGQTHHEIFTEKRLNAVFDISVSPLYDEEGHVSGCVHVMRDITERVRAEEERKAFEKTLQHTQKLESLGVLAGGIAHDFNNILSVILGHCFVLKNIPGTAPASNANVEQIESAATRASDLCRQLLAYAGKNPLLQKEFSVYSLVDEIVQMLKSAIPKNVTIKLDMSPDIPLIVGDSSQIQQVAMNLIINAGEAIGEKSGSINVRLKKTVIANGQQEIDYFGAPIPVGIYVCLVVTDNGCGMNEETRQRIFEPFYTTKFTGRGLGMSAILGIIKAHDGTLQLKSTPGVGTTFTVGIPVSRESTAVAASLIPEDFPEEPVRATVLLVDDEESLRNVGAALLEAFGYTIITAADGRQALEIYKERGREIDIIMLDLIMPEMGGIEAYHRLRSIDRDIPVIICSGYGVEAVVDTIAADTRAGFLQKPYIPRELSRVLREKCRNRVPQEV